MKILFSLKGRKEEKYYIYLDIIQLWKEKGKKIKNCFFIISSFLWKQNFFFFISFLFFNSFQRIYLCRLYNVALLNIFTQNEFFAIFQFLSSSFTPSPPPKIERWKWFLFVFYGDCYCEWWIWNWFKYYFHDKRSTFQ